MSVQQWTPGRVGDDTIYSLFVSLHWVVTDKVHCEDTWKAPASFTAGTWPC